MRLAMGLEFTSRDPKLHLRGIINNFLDFTCSNMTFTVFQVFYF